MLFLKICMFGGKFANKAPFWETVSEQKGHPVQLFFLFSFKNTIMFHKKRLQVPSSLSFRFNASNSVADIKTRFSG